MGKAQAHETAAWLDAQPLADREGVEVAVPGKDVLFGQPRRQLFGCLALLADGDGRHALRPLAALADAIDAHLRNGLEAADQAVHQLVFVVVDHRPGGLQQFTARSPGPRPAIARPQRGDIVDGRRRARQPFVVLGPRFPLAGQFVPSRAHAIGAQPFQVRVLAIEDAHMRAVELVGGTGQKVAVKRLNVDQTMRRILHGVDKRIGPDGLGPADDRRHIVDRAHGVGGIADRHQPCTRGDQRLHVLHVERAGFHIHIRPANLRASILGQHQPGRDVGVVVQARDHDLVLRPKLGGQRMAEGKGQAGHVVAKDDFRRLRAQQVGGSLAGVVDHGVRADRRLEDPVRVGVAPRVIVGDGGDHRFVHLRAAWVVKKDPLPAFIALLQGGELETDGVYVEHGGCVPLVLNE